MGKKAPKAPPAPDPVKTAQAQGEQNVNAAVAQANLNRIDQYTPQGNITYEQIGTNADGTPKYKQTQAYSPGEQQRYDQELEVDRSLNGLALMNVDRVRQAQSQPFSYNGMTPQVTNLGTDGLPALSAGPRQTPGVTRSPGYAGEIRSGFEGGGPLQSQIAGAGDVARAVTASPIQNNFNAGGPIQSQVGSTGQVQTQFGGSGNVQSGVDFSGTTRLPGTDNFGAEARRVADSVYGQAASRLDPQFSQQNSDMEARLANMGIARGSEAFNREMDNFNRAKTDAYNQANFSAIQAGGAEQSRLFGLAMGARQQGVNEQLASGNFTNAAQAQQYSQALGRGQFANEAQAQEYAQAIASGNFTNAAQAQQYSQNFGQAQFRNQAQAQEFGQGAANAELNNAAQGQIFGQNAQQLAANNTTQAQRFAQNQAQAQFGNVAQGQRFDQNLAGADFYNNAGAMDFSQQQSAAAMGNQARTQGYNERVTDANFQNSARQQQIQEATYLRNLPLNEIAALLGTGGGVQNPQFQGVSQVGVAAPDYMGAVYKNYDARLNMYNQQQAARSQGLGSIFGLAGSLGAAAISDRRVKENVTRIGMLANGLATYTFNYIGGKARQFGVMAQEALCIRPEAVFEINGILGVDYGKVYA